CCRSRTRPASPQTPRRSPPTPSIGGFAAWRQVRAALRSGRFTHAACVVREVDSLPALSDTDVVIVEAVRSPLGRRNGGLASVHPADLLGAVQRATVERSGIDPGTIGQVVAGCVSQTGEQTFDIGRTAWLG